MPKTINTPREELICGKLDIAEDIARSNGLVELVYLLQDIRYDAERMEAMLWYRKNQLSKIESSEVSLTMQMHFPEATEEDIKQDLIEARKGKIPKLSLRDIGEL